MKNPERALWGPEGRYGKGLVEKKSVSVEDLRGLYDLIVSEQKLGIPVALARGHFEAAPAINW